MTEHADAPELGTWRPLAELGAILLAYAAAEGALAGRAATWAQASTGRLAVRVFWGVLGDEARQRARAWRALAEDLAGPSLRELETPTAAASAAVAADLDAIPPTAEARLGVVAQVYLPTLQTAYRAHQATASALSEGPVRRLLGRILPDLDAASEEAGRLLSSLCAEGGQMTTRALSARQDFEASGSLTRLLRASAV